MYDLVSAKYETMDVLLESQGCERIPMEILVVKCVSEFEKNGSYEIVRKKLVRGVKNEEYSVSPPRFKTHWGDPDTLTIDGCENHGEMFASGHYPEMEKVLLDYRESKS